MSINFIQKFQHYIAKKLFLFLYFLEYKQYNQVAF